MMRRISLPALILIALCSYSWTQTDDSAAVERSYPFSVEAVQKALQRIGGFGGGKLPVLDGFVTTTDPERYDHPYFQYRVHLKSIDANNTLVSVEAKISALFVNQDPAHPEYQSLPSNGRLESDLHDRLQQALRGSSIPSPAAQPKKDAVPPALQAPEVATGKGSSAATTAQAQLDQILAERQSVREKSATLQAQLEQMRASNHNPSNASRIASVKRSGVGVMSRQNFGGPVLFRAQAEDEFEIVELESGWAQVRLSPDSTGYIQADELNLPSGVVEKQATAAPAKSPGSAAPAVADLGFSVSREDVTVFSGDWARLKGKKVLFVYAQPRGLLSDMGNEDAKLGYAKRIFETRYRSVSQSKTEVEGVVVVFLGTRGGVAAATLSDIRQWIEGGLADDAFVNRCSLDPPTEFRSMRLN
ncbi:MAG TPA: hypothetical protein VLL05_16475 [Terriglobales bacterium]|nr:hypothetical protein [Terriglobales bacterium]